MSEKSCAGEDINQLSWLDLGENLECDEYWHHFAKVCSPRDGCFKRYRDGENASASRSAYRSNDETELSVGILLFGMDASTNFRREPSARVGGVIDEFRIWSYERTESQIRQYLTSSVSPYEPGLEVLFRFDEGFDSWTVEDLTKKNPGMQLGSFPGILHDLINGLHSVLPPKRILSSLPMHSEVVVSVVSVSRPTRIRLQQEEVVWLGCECQIISGPMLGTLETAASEGAVESRLWNSSASGELVYIPDPGLADSGKDSFTYRFVCDDTRSADLEVQLVAYKIESPNDRSLRLHSNEALVVALTDGSSGVFEVFPVLISVPKEGQLFHVPLFPWIELSPKDAAKKINSTNEDVEEVLPGSVPFLARSGIVLYVPPLTTKSLDAHFEFKLVGKNSSIHRLGELESLPAAVTISVLPAKDTMASVHVITDSDTEMDVTLSSNTLHSSHPRDMMDFEITDLPTCGELKQLLPTAMDKLASVRYTRMEFDRTPREYIQWVSAIRGGTAIGDASFSSELGAHNSSAEGANVREGSAANILGAPDFSCGMRGENAMGWSPADGQSAAFITLEFEEEVFLTGIGVFEAFPSALFGGGVKKISVARDFAGNDTSWTVVWQGPAGAGQRSPAEAGFVTTPPGICRRGAIGRFLRLDLEVGQAPPKITGVRLAGTEAPSRGLVFSPESAVRYVPPAGVHGESVDSFQARAGDCVSWWSRMEYTVGVRAPANAGAASTVPELSINTTIVLGSNASRVSIDIASLSEFMAQRLGRRGCIEWSHSVALLLLNGSVSVRTGSGAQVLPGGELVPLAHPWVMMGAWRNFAHALLEVWSTSCGVTVRHRISVGPRCPGVAGGARMCALSPQECRGGDAYDAGLRACRPSTRWTVRMFIAVGGGSVLLGTAAALCLLTVRRRRGCRVKPQLSGRRVSSTTQMEMPLDKAIQFLGRVKSIASERDIQLEADSVLELLTKHSTLLSPTSSGLDGIHPEMQEYLITTATRDCPWQGLGGQAAVFPVSVTNDDPLTGSTIVCQAPQWLKGTLAQVGETFFFKSISFCSEAGSHCLQLVCVQLMERWGLFSALAIPQSSVHRFLNRVQQGYLPNPYHGIEHAVDVTCRLGAILEQAGVAQELIDRGREGAVTLLAAVLAAAVHDYKHPGLTNAFAVRARMPVARQFNDQAVLENQSLFISLEMLEADGTGIVSHLSEDLRGMLRNIIIRLVLATDMSRHFELLSAFQAQVSEHRHSAASRRMRAGDACHQDNSCCLVVEQEPCLWGSLSEEQRMVALQTAIKVADIGHCALPHSMHLEWLNRLEEEFFLQGDTERSQGLRVSPLMDRTKPGPTDPKNQATFMNVIVRPLYRAWCNAYPGCSPLYTLLKENHAHWESLSSKGFSVMDSGSYGAGDGNTSSPASPLSGSVPTLMSWHQNSD
eukprot:CAMPEP_0177617342 /NCGR_PEP_ID=MMETSP0419_2-20121207/24808_1 /TAXON_ID=582737 /ORGANISM="Tetraselmis sp., Strain GSL018" /LENGTH=1417 /DNA_ID=CAMNT_0019115801 /DNA_START=421 /DNA_END=4674 /DNA_ORIENTATION=-